MGITGSGCRNGLRCSSGVAACRCLLGSWELTGRPGGMRHCNFRHWTASAPHSDTALYPALLFAMFINGAIPIMASLQLLEG